jgi:hypothetical protein
MACGIAVGAFGCAGAPGDGDSVSLATSVKDAGPDAKKSEAPPGHTFWIGPVPKGEDGQGEISATADFTVEAGKSADLNFETGYNLCRQIPQTLNVTTTCGTAGSPTVVQAPTSQVPLLEWTVPFTAPSTPGTCTLTATSGSFSTTVTISVL